MGIARAAVCLLAEVNATHKFHGSILQLGKQTILATHDSICKTFNDFSLDISRLRGGGGVDSDTVLFHAFGFDTVDSMDVSSYEGATIVHDLNYEVPESLKNRFDFIYDGGTTEHVFNTPQVLKNICMMLKDGGIIIHFLPTNDYIEHGFYMFQPTLFADFYRANKFDILKQYIVEMCNHQYDINGEYTVYNYEQFSPLNANLTKKLLGTFFVANKNNLSTYDSIPQQGTFVAVWNNATSNATSNELHSQGSLGNIKRLFKSRFHSKHIVYTVTKRVYSFLRHLYRNTIKEFCLKVQMRVQRRLQKVQRIVFSKKPAVLRKY